MEIQFFGFIYEVIDSVSGQLARMNSEALVASMRLLRFVHHSAEVLQHLKCMRTALKDLLLHNLD